MARLAALTDAESFAVENLDAHASGSRVSRGTGVSL
jgi:hypothetical protein